MFQTLQVATLLLVAIAMSFAVAHAAEWPGKRRLKREAYTAVQTIYYPGFSLGGLSEPAAILALIALLYATPSDGIAFAWTAVALLAFIAMQTVYWLLTHPVNRIWLQHEKLTHAGAAFFAVGSKNPVGDDGDDDDDPPADGDEIENWKGLRDRWERSHILRACLGLAGLTALAIALTARG